MAGIRALVPESLYRSPPSQEGLADRLSTLLADLPEDTALLYFQCFFRTMRREWFGIDR